MMAMAALVFLLLLALTSPAAGRRLRESEGTWGLPDLAAVSRALDKVMDEKHLTPEQRKLAAKISDDVKKDIAALVAGGKNMTKEARQRKVMDAMKEMQSLQMALTPAKDNSAVMEAKLAKMEKELAAKKALLAKDQDEIKVLSLEKELAEKRIQLEGLEEAKDKAAKEKAAQDEEVRQREMVAKLVKMAKGLTAVSKAHTANATKATTATKASDTTKAANTTKVSKVADAGNATTANVSKAANVSQAKNVSKVTKVAKAINASHATQPAALQAITEQLEVQVKAVTDQLAKMDYAEKKMMAGIERMVKQKLPAKSGDKAAIAKSQGVFKMLKKKEQRKFEKARAMKKAELDELKTAIASIKKGDVKALERIMLKMQGEAKMLKANSKSFLH
eukprot:gnl/TRDRNA2_/TRDRNA2_180445_c0_seq1.p1 gnl/TRDRNA2_/TRDRNA2_180445_c0~~gnl/TRDRNA2_/TRDRNA2_180445_c0_seq1.p1  ORF type:complete len:392 (-),score=165.22 gnl/TRDRNA2_/TRDRNA2_180445_c0_seq1:164-1339(-)